MLDSGRFQYMGYSMYRKSKTLQIKKFWLEHEWIGACVIFIIAITAFAIWSSGPVFSDPDSFYHLKITKIMMKRQQAIVEFPWLQFTTLKDAFVDHHFLYHVFLIPFILFLDEFIGMKVATVLLAASTLTVFYILLRSLHVKYATLFTLFLLFTSSFAFRMGLAKAPSVGFLFLVTAFLLLAHKKHRLLILLGFFYVWSYGGFILLLVVAGIYSIVTWLLAMLKDRKKLPSLRQLWSYFTPFFAACAGVVAGLLIHPAFPHHLKFYWQQVVQIGLINYQEVIGVGGEWYPTEIENLITSPIILSSLIIISIIVFIVKIKKQTAASITALIMTIIFFVFTLKSQRYIEYYIPWGYIFVALTLHAGGALDQVKHAISSARKSIIGETFLQGITAAVLVYFVFIIPGIMITEARKTHESLHRGISVYHFDQLGEWLRDHATKGDVVFHNDWDDFPMLFYNAARARYIVGLDPTFMYNYDRDLYWKWVNITIGKQEDQLLEIIQGDFNARFIIIDHEHTAMKKNIVADGRFKEAYTDDEVTVYRVPRKDAHQNAAPEEATTE